MSKYKDKDSLHTAAVQFTPPYMAAHGWPCGTNSDGY